MESLSIVNPKKKFTVLKKSRQDVLHAHARHMLCCVEAGKLFFGLTISSNFSILNKVKARTATKARRFSKPPRYMAPISNSISSYLHYLQLRNRLQFWALSNGPIFEKLRFSKLAVQVEQPNLRNRDRLESKL